MRASGEDKTSTSNTSNTNTSNTPNTSNTSKLKTITKLKIGALILVSILLLFYYGIQKLLGEYCIIKVTSISYGSAIDGRDLGGKPFSKRYKVREGDVLYETADGHWTKEHEEGDGSKSIIKVVYIDKSGVGVDMLNAPHGPLDEPLSTVEYRETIELNSGYTVYDGLNYKYKVTFKRR